MEKIFIQIASYCDPELVPTIISCLSNATHPERLRFGIAWQHSQDDKELIEFVGDIDYETYDYYKDDIKFIDIDALHSKGACWARYLIQSALYTGEEYTLQIDSHMRFARGWDVMAIDMIKDLQSRGHEKPLLTAYTSSYDPENDPEGRVKEVWRMDFDRYTPEGIILFLPAAMTKEELESPLPARFYSAHMTFTLGQFCREVQHDPQLYFIGEECSLAVRAYTNGYDLFHPNKILCWHEYTRKGRVKHWDLTPTWWQMDKSSTQRFELLIETEFKGQHGLGTVRTIEQYKQYSGVDLKNKMVQQYTLDHKQPPNNLDDQPFVGIFKYCINLARTQFQYNDYQFFAVIFKDKFDRDMFRLDCDQVEITQLLSSTNNELHLWRTYYTDDMPVRWIVWPYSTEHHWCEKLEGII